LQEGERRAAELQAQGRQAFREGRYVDWLVTQVRRVRHRASAVPPEPVMRPPRGEENPQTAAELAETRIVQTLGAEHQTS